MKNRSFTVAENKIRISKYFGSRMNLFNTYLSLIIYTGIALSTGSADGAIISSSGSGNWNNTSTWTGGIIPGASDSVIIGTGHTITTAVNQNCAALNIVGNLTMSSSTLLNVASKSPYTGSVYGNGRIISGSPCSISFTGNWSFTGSAPNANMISISVTGSQAQSMSGDLTNFADFMVNKPSGTVSLNGALNLNGNPGDLKVIQGTIDPKGYLITINGSFTFTNGTIRVGASKFSDNYSRNPGTFTTGTTVEYNSAGDQTVAAFNYSNLLISGKGTKTLESTAAVKNTLTISSGVVFSMSSYILTLEGDLKNNGGTTSGSGGVTITGSVAQNLDSFTSSGTVLVKKDAASATFNGNVSGGSLNVTCSGSTLYLGTGLTHSFTGTMILNAGKIDCGSSTLSLSASSPVTGNGATFTANKGTVDYSGADQTIAQLSYNHLTLSGSGTKTIVKGISIGGNFTLKGTASANAVEGLTIGGNVEIGSGCTFTAGAYNHNLSGNWTNSGTYTGGSETVTFKGTSSQSINGKTTFNNLVINNSTGVTLNSDENINGNLTLTLGIITTGSNILTVSGNISGGSASSHVSGKLARVFSATGSKVFQTGKGGKYRPLTVQYTSLDKSSIVIAEQFESSVPGSLPSGTVIFPDHYWILSQTGAVNYAYKITLDGSAYTPVNTDNALIIKGDGTTNTSSATTYSSPGYTNADPFTSFGYTALGEAAAIWKGISGDWFSSSNWSTGKVPIGKSIINVPPNVSFFPQITGTSPENNVTIVNGSTVTIEEGASLTLSAGPVLKFESGSSIHTSGSGKIILKSGAVYLNLCSGTPTLQVELNMTGTGKGWRMISSPVTAAYSAMFKSPFVTQGYSGSAYPDLQPNLLWWAETDGSTVINGWRKPLKMSDPITGGLGYFFYIFNGALKPSPLTGTYSDALPALMTVTGTEFYSGSGSFSYTLTKTARSSVSNTRYTDTAGEGWNLIGNPTASTLDWNASSGWTKSNIDNTFYIWDNKANNGNGDYRFWNGNPSSSTLGNGLISPFQAYWVHASGASPSLQFTNDVKASSTVSFISKGYADNSMPVKNAVDKPVNSNIVVPLRLEGIGMESSAFISLGEDGSTGSDAGDVYRLEPMCDTWMGLYMNGSVSNREPLLVNSLPLDTSITLTLPLYTAASKSGISAGGDMILSWTIPSEWPDEFTIELMDHMKGKAVSMRDINEYHFTLEATKGTSALAVNPTGLPSDIIKMTGQQDASKGSVTTSTPFSVVIRKGLTGEKTAYERLSVELMNPAPNPISEHTTIGFRLPEDAQVKIEVYDMYGRLLEVPVAGNYPAGLNQVEWSPEKSWYGVCIFRLTSGNMVTSVKGIRIK